LSEDGEDTQYNCRCFGIQEEKMNSKDRRNHLAITVDVEEWFHTDFFDVEKVINKHYDGEYPRTDIIENVKKLLKLFEKYDVQATFFVLGETAEKYPDLLPLLEETPHEIACHGYYHNKKYNDLTEFKDDLNRFKEEIKSDVKGYRHPNFKVSKEMLKAVKEVGFQYDSSIVPCRNIPGWYGNPDLPLTPFDHQLNGTSIREFPVAVSPRLRLPGGGGWYLRNIGYWWTKRLVKGLLKKKGYATIYMHPWEFSDNNPDIKEVPFHVFRRTGDYYMRALEKIIRNFKTRKKFEFNSLEQEFNSLEQDIG